MTIVCTSAETVLQVDADFTCHYCCSQTTPSSWQVTTKEKKPLIWKICAIFPSVLTFAELHK